MGCLDASPLVRSRIAMFLHSSAGDPSARALLADASAVLRVAEEAVLYWKQRAEQAEAVCAAEIDDGK